MQKQTALRSIAIIVPTIAVVSFYVGVLSNSYNFPYFDDFEVILAFLNRFLTADQVSEKFRLLMEQHLEHRVVFDRAVVLAEYFMTGKIDFRALILIGNAALIGILVLCYRCVQRNDRIPLLCLAPVAPLLFNFRYSETSFWAMAALQNLWVLCFAFAAFYFLFEKRTSAFLLAVVLGWLATFTSGNGMLVFIVGMIMLALDRQFWTRKALVWSVAGAVAIALYFYRYAKPAEHPAVIEPLLRNPGGFATYVLALLGGMVTENLAAAVIIGLLLTGTIACLVWRRFWRENPVISAVILFLVASSIVAGLARFGFGADQALASRYAIISTLLVVSCYLALVTLVHNRLNSYCWVAMLALALCFHYGTYAKYLPPKKAEKANVETDLARVAQGKISHFTFGWPPLDKRREFPRQVLREADDRGYFSLKFKDDAEILESLPTDPTKKAAYQFEHLREVGPVIVTLSGWAFIPGVDSKDVIPVACFKDEQGRAAKYIVLPQLPRDDIAQKYSGDQADHQMAGFQTFFDRAELKSGRYSLTLFLAASNFKVEIDPGPIKFEWRERGAINRVN